MTFDIQQKNYGGVTIWSVRAVDALYIDGATVWVGVGQDYPTVESAKQALISAERAEKEYIQRETWLYSD